MDESKRLRALLDERGIEHDDNDANTEVTGVRITRWKNGGKRDVRYEEWRNGTTRLDAGNVSPEQAIAATVGEGMTLDEATEYAEKFMSDYAKVLLASTLYLERDEPTDQHALDVAEQKEGQMARGLAEALATAGGYTITFAPTLDRPPETMVGETVYDAEGNAVGWIANATVGVGTCEGSFHESSDLSSGRVPLYFCKNSNKSIFMEREAKVCPLCGKRIEEVAE